MVIILSLMHAPIIRGCWGGFEGPFAVGKLRTKGTLIRLMWHDCCCFFCPFSMLQVCNLHFILLLSPSITVYTCTAGGCHSPWIIYQKRAGGFKYSCRLCKWIYSCQHALWWHSNLWITFLKPSWLKVMQDPVQVRKKPATTKSLSYSHNANKNGLAECRRGGKKTQKFSGF